jgi:hypothetical protein
LLDLDFAGRLVLRQQPCDGRQDNGNRDDHYSQHSFDKFSVMVLKPIPRAIPSPASCVEVFGQPRAGSTSK